MNIETAINLQSEKGVSAFEQMMTKAVQGTSNIQMSFKVAIERIEKNTPYKKILTLIPIKTIELVKFLDGDKRDKKVSGRYEHKDSSITLREVPALRMMVVDLLCHEVGHHLATNYLNPDNHDAHGHLLRPKGNNVYVKYEMVDDFYAAANDEYEEEKAAVERRSGISIGDNLDDHFEKLFKAGTKAPSIYALRTLDEWFGEAFALAFTESDKHKAEFAKRFPNTWKSIQSVLTGEILAKSE